MNDACRSFPSCVQLLGGDLKEALMYLANGERKTRGRSVQQGAEMEHFWAVWEWGKSTLALLGLGGATIGGAAAVGYGLFKWLGEKWIDQKFEKQMEAYKTEQSRELERLRHKINGIFDRTIRLHTKEFEVLPDIWGKLVEAHAWASAYSHPVQTYTDVGRMDDKELDEYLTRTAFTEAQKRDVKQASATKERQALYSKFSNHDRHNDAAGRIRTFALSLMKDGIFLKPEIKADMDRMLDLISNALLEKKMCEDRNITAIRMDEYKRLENEGQPLLKRIEMAVSARLWDSTTAEV